MKWRPWNVMEGCISCKQYKRDICRFALDPKGKPIGVAINNACHSSEMDQTCEEVCWVKWRQNNNQDFTLVTGGLSRPQLQGDSRHPPPAEVSRERGWMVSWLLTVYFCGHSDNKTSTSMTSSRRTSSSVSAWWEWRTAREAWGWPRNLSGGEIFHVNKTIL